MAFDLFPDGIFFGLSEEAYHALPRLGSTDHKKLLVNPVQWRWEKMVELRESLGLADPTPKEKEKASEQAVGKEFGTAVDMLLTNPEGFHRTYVEEPLPPKPLLTSIEAIRNDLIEPSGLPKAAKRYDVVVEARHIGLKTGMLPEDWEEQRKAILDGKVAISKRWVSILALIDKMLDMGRADFDGQSVREAVLSNGQPQVSVLWTDERGVKCKCRFDYLRLKANIDIKTYAGREGQEPGEAFWSAVANFAYDMQAEHYSEGRRAMRALWEAGRVFGDHDAEWLRKVCLYGKRPVWTWVAICTRGMPEVDVFQFPEEGIATAAQVQVQAARTKYLEYSSRFGSDEPWVSTRGPIRLTDLSCPFPGRMTSRADERWRLPQ